MLSYQHAYHAGGPADLHKHIVFAELIAAMTRKPRGLSVFETHAGRGLYDLGSAEAAKTGEAAMGIGRVAPPADSAFGMALAAVRAVHGPTAYPGSPLVARALLRPQDRLTLMELHPGEHAALVAAVPGTAVHRRDGYEGVLGQAPPTPRRGLVLVDPSYEVKTEYGAAAAFILRLIARWPEAVVLLWYPLLPEGRHRDMVDRLRLLNPRTDEVDFEPRPKRGMTGSGLALVNGPFGSEKAFRAAHRQAAVLRPQVRR